MKWKNYTPPPHQKKKTQDWLLNKVRESNREAKREELISFPDGICVKWNVTNLAGIWTRHAESIFPCLFTSVKNAQINKCNPILLGLFVGLQFVADTLIATSFIVRIMIIIYQVKLLYTKNDTTGKMKTPTQLNPFFDSIATPTVFRWWPILFIPNNCWIPKSIETGDINAFPALCLLPAL